MAKRDAPREAADVVEDLPAQARSLFRKIVSSIVGLVVLGLFLCVVIFGCYRVFFVKAVENYEVAFKYNWWTGSITKVDHPGWMTVYPFIMVGHTLDGRPKQVCINANTRVLNCKLIRFNPEGLSQFIDWHGRSAGDDPDNLFEILKSYAYDGTPDGTYPFLTIERKLEATPLSTGATAGPTR